MGDVICEHGQQKAWMELSVFLAAECRADPTALFHTRSLRERCLASLHRLCLTPAAVADRFALAMTAQPIAAVRNLQIREPCCAAAGTSALRRALQLCRAVLLQEIALKVSRLMTRCPTNRVFQRACTYHGVLVIRQHTHACSGWLCLHKRTGGALQEHHGLQARSSCRTPKTGWLAEP